MTELGTESLAALLDARLSSVAGTGVRAVYDSSGTWTNPYPTEHRRMSVICIGGGDGGSRGAAGRRAPGGSGGGWYKKDFWTDELPSTVTFSIGVGGNGATSNNTYGGNGTPTIFGSTGTEWLRSIRGCGGYEREDGFIEASAASPGRGGGNGFFGSGDGAIAFTPEWGEDSAFAPGGRPGQDNANGEDGGSAPAGTTSGGAGGGGGTYAVGWFSSGGAGGDGGFPGGGGGAGSGQNGGKGGNGRMIVTIYETMLTGA